MTLQELIGELNTLALAYPPETQVTASWRDMNRSEIVGVMAESTDEVRIVIEAQ